MKKGYHGTHFGGASVNGNANFRRNYEPLLPGVFHIPAPWTYRNPFNETDPARLAKLCAAALEDEIAFQGADTIAAFIMEPVLGAGGVIVPPDSFMTLAREICDRHGILLIADEVVTGFGRTGAWSGSRLLGREAGHDDHRQGDHLGLLPARRDLDRRQGCGGVRDRQDQLRLDRPRLHLFRPPRRLRRRPCGARRDQAARSSTRMRPRAARSSATALERLKAKHALVGDVRCKGLMAAIELVSDRATQESRRQEDRWPGSPMAPTTPA